MNESGIHPTEYKVLVKPKKVEEKTTGGIFMPDSARDKERYATTTGILIDASANAFTEPNWRVRPMPGDTVMFNRYAGDWVKGKDGEEYQIINDREIKAILDSDYEEKVR